MKTVLLPSTEGASGNLCLKVAEDAWDRRRLARTRTNLAFLRRSLPEVAPEIIDDGEDKLVTSAWEGTTFNSEQAPAVYESLPWIIDAILTQLDKLQSCAVDSVSLISHKLRFLGLLLRPWKSGVRLPLAVQRQLLSLPGKSREWVLSHGDLTEWNIVVDRAGRSVAFIDWEELAFRPWCYDELFLAFHRCTSVDEMTWQRSLLKERLLSQDDAGRKVDKLHAVALGALTFHYVQDVQRVRSNPDDPERRQRLRVRQENLSYLTEGSNWQSWIDWVLAG